MLGDGQRMYLLKLYLIVKEKGGYEEVSKNGLWGLVAKECGFDLRVVSDLKLVYVKYFDLLDRWSERIVKEGDSKSEVMEKISNFSEVSMDLGLGFTGILNEISDRKKKDGECLNVELKRELDFLGDGKLFNGQEHPGVLESNGGFRNVDNKRAVEDGEKGGFENVEVNRSGDINDMRSMSNVSEDRSVETGEKDDPVSESSVVEENESSRKRKREYYSGMIKWVLEVSKDPCDPAIGPLPGSRRWQYYGHEHLWKQVLLVREAMLLKRNTDSSARQSIWQNKPMQPAMYEDPIVRCSRRVLSAKESHDKSRRRICQQSSSSATDDDISDKKSDSTADLTEFWINSYRQKRVPLGPYFQADVLEWNGETQESDSKWLGTRMWPLEMREQNKFLIERERIGKGRQDSCGCQSPGSFECVRFHIAEKRTRVKLELGPAFCRWKFDNMGENAALSWTKEEEKKFQDIVKSNPLSLGKCFWDELLKAFPRKGGESLVNYYFNVFLIQHRGYQNRTTPTKIDSDDEAESGSQAVNPPGSIFCSPKKVHLNFR